MKKKFRVARVILTTVLVVMFAVVTPQSFGQGGQVKEGGKEVGRAGKSLGHNVRHRRLVRGGKQFGRHMGQAGRHVGRAGKHVGRRTKRVVKRAVD